jgi:hypothetical protein
MHQPVKDNLEDYLNRRGEREMPGEMAAHLQACLSCAREFEQIEKQSSMLRSSLRTECEPRPGFYARVMDRIDRQADNSIWAVLLRPAFGRRIAIVSGALVMLLGSYLITSERSAPAAAQQEVSQESTLPQQRDAVLVNLASYHE